MNKQLESKLIASSNAVHHFMLKEDDMGMAELTTKGIIVSIAGLFGIFIVSAVMIGGF